MCELSVILISREYIFFFQEKQKFQIPRFLQVTLNF